MKLKPVKSSNIQAIGYEPATQELHVQFHESGLYKFKNVSPAKYAALMAAESHGKHFQAHIRHSHEFEKVST